MVMWILSASSQSLEKLTETKRWDVEQLVKIYIEESNFTEAENTLKRYLNPSTDNDIFQKYLPMLGKQ